MTKYEKIMIIDDDEIDRYLVSALIKNNQLAKNILEFDNGDSAIQYLEKNKDHEENLPEIILLDIYMPKMTGFEFIEKFEKIAVGFKNKCKICVVSSSINDNDIIKTKLNSHVFKFTTKPITSEFLLAL